MRKEKETLALAKFVCHGAYQYVLLPKGFEFEGDCVEIEKYREGIMLKPFTQDNGSERRKKAIL
jgi:hypothetical protein